MDGELELVEIVRERERERDRERETHKRMGKMEKSGEREGSEGGGKKREHEEEEEVGEDDMMALELKLVEMVDLELELVIRDDNGQESDVVFGGGARLEEVVFEPRAV